VIDKYLAAEYRIFEPGIVLRVGVRSPELGVLFASTKTICAFFITAYNPFSETTKAEVNTLASARLADRLRQLYPHAMRYLGAGVDPTGEWPSEQSKLVLLPAGHREQLVDLAREFGQNAYLYSDLSCVPELVHVTHPHRSSTPNPA